MNRLALAVLCALACMLASAGWCPAFAEAPEIDFSTRPIPNLAGGFSVMFPVIARVQGASTFFYPAVDVSNHHDTQATEVTFLYTSADLSFTRTGTLTTLQPRTNFHTDDFIQFLVGRGALTQPQADSAFGTLVLTFMNTSFTQGTEASAVLRFYNYVTGNSGPSIGLAYRAQVLRKNGAHKLASVISDTNYPGVLGPALSTNLGLANLAIDDAGNDTNTTVTVKLTFYNASTGAQVGVQPDVVLGPRQVTQINDIFTKYSIPADLTSLIVVAEGPTGAGQPQIEGYVSFKDVSTSDGSYFFMQPQTVASTPTLNLDGKWQGLTNEGEVVEFTVANNAITKFKMAFAFSTPSATCNTAIEITYTVPKAITNGSFSFNFSPTGLSTAIAGTFNSSSSMSGTFGQVNMNNYQCGTLTINGFKAGGTFSASK